MDMVAGEDDTATHTEEAMEDMVVMEDTAWAMVDIMTIAGIVTIHVGVAAMEDTTTTTEDMAAIETDTMVEEATVPTEDIMGEVMAMVVTMDTTGHHSKEESGADITDTMDGETASTK